MIYLKYNYVQKILNQSNFDKYMGFHHSVQACQILEDVWDCAGDVLEICTYTKSDY